MRSLGVMISGVGLLAACLAHDAHAFGRKPPEQTPAPAPTTLPPGVGKRVLKLEPVRNVRIELPDQSFHDFGDDLRTMLVTRLTNSGQFIVTEDRPSLASKLMAAGSETPPDYEWSGTWVPAGSVKIDVDALTFTTGNRGERMLYGFNERFTNRFNDGGSAIPNEFPLRDIAFEPAWFDRFFDGKGTVPWDSRSGLDLGDGFGIDLSYAALTVKYALYRSDVHLNITVTPAFGGKTQFKRVEVFGKGFFFDVSGAYEAYSGGITIARRDAMNRAVQNALAGSLDAVTKAMSGLPLTARIDGILEDGTLLLGTGRSAGVSAGTKYEVVSDTNQVVEVMKSVTSGAIAKQVAGTRAQLKPGLLLREVVPDGDLTVPDGSNRLTKHGVSSVSSSSSASSSASDSSPITEVVELPDTNLPKSDFKGTIEKGDIWKNILIEALKVTQLPFRIARYFQYDQAYHKDPDRDSATQPWSQAARQQPWAKQIGLDVAGEMRDAGEQAPIVAILDTGVDYNHPAVHSSLWLNPAPVTDPQGQLDRYGWDFISGDSRSYDDAYHGTEAASAVLAVAPKARIMALKVFNPFGVTSSASIYGAFQYAVQHGAKIIVCGWATRHPSASIPEAVELARQAGVIVVAAAGDRGDNLDDVPAYPASLATISPNVLSVAGVDTSDALVQLKGRYSNFSPVAVKLAAPGQDISVADPRGDYAKADSTRLAAAITAGALARIFAADPALDARGALALLRARADIVPALSSSVEGGLRLRLAD